MVAARTSALPPAIMYKWGIRPQSFIGASGYQHGVEMIPVGIRLYAGRSLVALGAYVLNDLLDIASDRAHPRKRHRPFASGRIPVSRGSGLAAALILACTHRLSALAETADVPDICVLAGLYTLRIVAGGVASDIALSAWLFAFSTFFFSLAAIKRQAELVDMRERGNGREGRALACPVWDISGAT